MAFKNTLSWSYTTMRTYEACPRQYWYKKFGGWNGWRETDPESERRITWLLGKVQNRWMWRGDVIHNAIERIIQAWRRGDEPARDELKDDLRRTFRSGFRASKQGLLLQGNNKATGLAEHLFEETSGESVVSDADWKRLVEGADAMLDRFLESPIAAEVKAVEPEKWLSLEDLLTLVVENATVYIKMDAAWHEPGRAVIVDWKTGKTETDAEGHSLQLGLYSIYAAETWGLPTLVREVTLSDMTVREWEPEPRHRDELRERVAATIAVIRERLTETEQGIDADRELFPATPSAKTCRGCAWRPICPQVDDAARVSDSWRNFIKPKPIGIPVTDAAGAALVAASLRGGKPADGGGVDA